MIGDDEELRATYEALGDLYQALASLRQTVLPVNPRQYALFAEGPLDEIQKLQAEIEVYLGLREQPADAATALREQTAPYDARKKK